MQPIVYILENFYSNFANLVALPTDGTMKRLLHCKVLPPGQMWNRIFVVVK